MNDLISRAELLQGIEKDINRCYQLGVDCVGVLSHFADRIKDAPAVDAVPKSYADQIRWERDIAIEQLEEIGCQLGQKMDDVKKKLDAVPVVHGEWIAQDATYTRFMCSACNSKNYSGHHNFCPNCGARMDGE